MMSSDSSFRCGYIGICGRPNVGKSTLLNHLIGQKLSITSRRPHTTRWHVLGIHTTSNTQLIFMDMPGLKQQRSNALNRFMHREVADGLLTIDVAVFVIEALRWTDEDEYVLDHIKQADRPVILVVNKTDRVSDKKALLPFIDSVSAKHDFAAIFPLSARHDDMQSLQEKLTDLMPEQPAMFPEDQISDRNERFFVAEMLREQLVRNLGDELPYRLTVVVEDMKVENNLAHIHALIWVESEGQKAIVIGESGERLKKIATQARLSMEKFLDMRVNLKTWVKVRDSWTDDVKSMREFGYDG
ncbi:GTP-binding protein Era [Methylohalomonas lacus]|uniref:GTPase Era n=1 Tax=Methylohalomonas lacus TaxID=398773 RepID=A0AAE3L0T7_9GAMM|nr:GTP-binding protein Era [Methylohalomonas lacus]